MVTDEGKVGRRPLLEGAPPWGLQAASVKTSHLQDQLPGGIDGDQRSVETRTSTVRYRSHPIIMFAA